MMWLNVDGYDGKYQISEKGNVRLVSESKGVKPLKPCVASNGKYYIELWKDGKRKSYMLHNVLSDTFKIPVEEANRVIYDGFHGTVGARENVRKWVLERIGECERSINDYHDEILYLKKFLEIL